MSQSISLDQIVPLLIKSNSQKPDITVLCGGTGSGQIIKELQDYFQVSILINAYDDGKSTGKIRDAFDMLGPSDIVKNITTLIDTKRYPGLEAFLDYRFINNNPSDNLMIKEEITAILEDRPVNPALRKGGRFLGLYYGLEKEFVQYIKSYFDQFYSNLPKSFDLRDCATRNVVFTGCFLKNEKNYEKTIDELRDLFGINTKIILNSHENRKLIALSENGAVLPSEHEILEYNSNDELTDLFVIKEPLTKKQLSEINSLNAYKEKKSYISSHCNTSIEPNPLAVSKLEQSDVILFGPTTYNSSLLPTLMTPGINEAIRGNAIKVGIINLIKEQSNVTASYFPKKIKEAGNINLDYILVSNYNGYITDDLVPVDDIELQKYGNIIKENFYAGFGKHQPDFVAKTVFLLYSLSKNGRKRN